MDVFCYWNSILSSLSSQIDLPTCYTVLSIVTELCDEKCLIVLQRKLHYDTTFQQIGLSNIVEISFHYSIYNIYTKRIYFVYRVAVWRIDV